jgi:uroporphyrinogen decarboxylase
MSEMTGTERMLKVMRLQEPDRVPHFELYLDPSVGQAILPGSSFFDWVEYFDWDGMLAWIGELSKPVDESGKRFLSEWGYIEIAAGTQRPLPTEPPVKSEKDLETWKPPDPDNPKRYEAVKEEVRRYKGQRAIIGISLDPFEMASYVRGTADFYMDLVRNPDFADHLTGIIRDHYIKEMRNAVELGADIWYFGALYVAKEGPLISRELIAKHVMPFLKSLVDEAHRLGVPVIYHLDGNILPIIDLILETGINALHPIDRLAGLDLGEMKKNYGDRVCLMGNIDCGSTLVHGTVDEVRDEVKRCIRQAAVGGGYICKSSNTIQYGTKPENYEAMVKAIHEYGKYPISL